MHSSKIWSKRSATISSVMCLSRWIKRKYVGITSTCDVNAKLKLRYASCNVASGGGGGGGGCSSHSRSGGGSGASGDYDGSGNCGSYMFCMGHCQCLGQD